jgi:hypothetical protein
MTARLGAFVQTLNVLPVSSAACERGFSQLNLQHTAVRNRLTISSISNLLMISINALCLTVCDTHSLGLNYTQL